MPHKCAPSGRVGTWAEACKMDHSLYVSTSSQSTYFQEPPVSAATHYSSTSLLHLHKQTGNLLTAREASSVSHSHDHHKGQKQQCDQWKDSCLCAELPHFCSNRPLFAFDSRLADKTVAGEVVVEKVSPANLLSVMGFTKKWTEYKRLAAVYFLLCYQNSFHHRCCSITRDFGLFIGVSR